MVGYGLCRCNPRPLRTTISRAICCHFSSGSPRLQVTEIHDRYASLREHYQTPRNPIVLAHGLLGFNELQLAGAWMPRIHYWYGIEEALESRGSQVLTTAVPPSASIEERAQTLSDTISQQLPGQKVNIIAHSMGGLDSRFLISKIQPANFTVASLTTIASPHRGSPVADYIMGGMGPTNVARVRGLLDKFSIPSGAFMQLTHDYMCDQFNSTVLDDPAVKYYSFGAYCKPTLTSVFRQSHRIIADAEGPNDGLVSVDSSIWGDYRGTLVNVSHLDLINWTNQIRWWARENLLGKRRTFNAVAFYLDIAEMLAKDGL